jgi:hypothetical protein
MDKGIDGWQNLLVLKWARENGIRLSWLMLWGMPNERDEWFERQASWIPLIEHLQPPFGVVRIRFDRYSVYHSRAADFGLRLVPTTALRHIFPLPADALDDLAYCFREAGDPDVFESASDPPREERAVRPGLARLVAAAERWRRVFGSSLPPLLSVADDGETLRFLDTRRCAVELRPSLSGELRDAYLQCEGAPRRERVAGADELLRLRLVLEIDGRLVALGLRGDVPPLASREESPGGAVLQDIAPAALRTLAPAPTP